MFSIGQLARLAGLTTKALRHYDRIGLLRPAVVDPVTSYRRYAQQQLDAARLIRRLRAVDLPLDEIAAVLADPAALRDTLARHRRRVEARLVRLRGVLHELDHHAGSTGHTHQDEDTMTTDIDTAEGHKRLAKQLFNEVWTLMGTEDRGTDDDALMIHKAHASLYHWLQCGTPANNARGEWQVSRVYTVLGRGEAAVYHARRVLDICQRNGIGDWDLAFAYEALARAHTVAGDAEEAARYLDLARAAGDDIAEDDDRELLLSDLETIPRLTVP